MLERFADGTYISTCWKCGHGYHAERVSVFTRCRCCHGVELGDERAQPTVPTTICPLDELITGGAR